MKFCLSSRQTPEYLQQADEIKVASNDYKQVYDLLDKYPDKTIILNYTDQPKEAMRELAILAQGRLILCIFDFLNIELAKELNLPYYYGIAIQTLDELRAAKNLGVCYTLIDNQLTHQLYYVKAMGVPVRAIPNISSLDGIPRENGINGNWIRPEDIDAYSLYIDTIEFGTQPQKREQTLFRIYSQDKEWHGQLERIVQDLNFSVFANPINQEFLLRRMNCGMTCTNADGCSLCYDLFKIANKEIS